MSDAVESLTKVGVVTGITSEVKTTKDGSRKFTVHNILVDGKKYGLGYKAELVTNAGVAVGDTAKVTLVKKGDYWNVDSIEKTAAQETAMTTQGQVTSPTPTPTTSSLVRGTTQTQYARQVALQVAGSLVSGFANDPRRKAPMALDQQVAKTVGLADHFVTYIETGKVEVLTEGAKADAEKVVEAVAEG